MKNLGIYVHIPFCKKKCAYCDFVSFSGIQSFIPKYIETLEKEIKNCNLIKKEYNVETIYFGGRNTFVY